jgi:hypothetical protein
MSYRLILCLSALLFLLPAPSALALSQSDMVTLLKTIDTRQRNVGDWKALAWIKSKERGKSDIVREMVVYRRDRMDKFMILILNPRSEAGKGYLRIDANMWMYDPTVGKWERRTERDRIAGTDSRRADFDESRLAKEYIPTYLGQGKLGKYQVHKLRLKAKKKADVPWPIMELWIDQTTKNVLKRQEFALSGKLSRTSLYPKWMKLLNKQKQQVVWYPREMYFRDELEKGNLTHVKMKKVDLSNLPLNIFTKAWLESKSR